MAVGAGRDNCFGQATLCVGSGLKRLPDRSQRRSVIKLGCLPIVVLEAGGELVGVVDDLFGGSGIGITVRYFGRASAASYLAPVSRLQATSPNWCGVVSSRQVKDRWRAH